MNRVFTIRKLRSSVRQEKSIARDVGGRRVAGSGSQPGNKGDVQDPQGWLIEAKQTVKPRYALTLLVWRKIEREALQRSSKPVLVLDIAGRKLAVVSYNDWLDLRNR